MSAGVENTGQDFDLNLAPIIDCFTVLITYLLVTASFISLTAMDVGVSATGKAPPATPSLLPPPMIMTMELTLSQKLVIKINGGKEPKEITVAIEPKNGSWNFDGLGGRLIQIQKKWPSITDVSVSAEPTVQYKEVVKVINEIQKNMPKVFISG